LLALIMLPRKPEWEASSVGRKILTAISPSVNSISSNQVTTNVSNQAMS
jgi:hypothetical protein